MDPPDRRLPLLHGLAWTCVLLVLAITSLSAFMRLSRAGLGCEPWPQCHVLRAGVAAESLTTLDGPAVTAARAAHRVAATTALLLIVVLLVQALARTPRLWRVGRIVLALFALALFLAVLGRLGGASRAPPVTVGNLLAGFAMLALGARLLQLTRAAPSGVPALRGWTLLAIGLVLLQSALGGGTSARAAAGRCDAALSCQVHALLAPTAVALLVGLGVAAWRRGRRAGGAAVALLALVQGGLGVAQIAGPLPLAVGLAHNIAAALLLAATVALLPALRPQRRAGPTAPFRPARSGARRGPSAARGPSARPPA